MPAARTTARVRYLPVVAALVAALVTALLGIAVTGLASPTGIAGPSAVVLAAIPLVRVVLNIAAVATLGLSLLPVLLGSERPQVTEPVTRVARRSAVATALVWAAAAVVTLLLDTRERSVGTAGIGVDDIVGHIADVASGQALVLVAVLALAHAVVGAVAVRRPNAVPAEARVGLALVALLPLSVTGHATTWNLHDITMISIELHVLAAAAWTGGLGAMATLLAGNRGLLVRALPRFSVLATVCLLVTAATGLFNGIVEVQLPPNLTFVDGLLTTSYGQLVLAKTACLVAIAAVGARLRWRMLPAVQTHRHTAFATWAVAELTIMGMAFGFAAVLSGAPVS